MNHKNKRLAGVWSKLIIIIYLTTTASNKFFLEKKKNISTGQKKLVVCSIHIYFIRCPKQQRIIYALYWDSTQRRVICLAMKNGTDRLCRNVGTTYSKLCRIPKGPKFHLRSGGNLKSCITQQ